MSHLRFCIAIFSLFKPVVPPFREFQSLTMSLSTMSKSDVQQLTQLLKQAKDSGMLQVAMASMNENSAEDILSGQTWEEVEAGAMTDGSKRRMSEEPVRDRQAGGSGTQPSLEPLVVSPAQWRCLEEIGYGLIPNGMESVEKWSDALITFGKLKGSNLSYFDLLTSAQPEHTSYVKWMLDHETEKSTPLFKDLVAFIRLFRRVCVAPSIGTHFPGTQVTRVFKTKS